LHCCRARDPDWADQAQPANAMRRQTVSIGSTRGSRTRTTEKSLAQTLARARLRLRRSCRLRPDHAATPRSRHRRHGTHGKSHPIRNMQGSGSETGAPSGPVRMMSLM
jgi:hypothetical protein